MRWRRLRLEASAHRLSSHHRLDSGAASSCALDKGAGRRGSCALAAVRWRRLSTRDARPSPLVPAAASTAARRGGYTLDSGAARQLCASPARLEASVHRLSSHRRLDSGAASSCALDGGAARQQCAGAAFNPRPPSVASRLIAVWTAARRAARRAAVRWTAGRLGSCVPAQPLNSGRPSVAPRFRRRLDSGAARRLCAGTASPLETPVRRLLSLSPPVQRRGEAALRWTAARRGSSALAPPHDSRSPSVASRLIAV